MMGFSFKSFLKLSSTFLNPVFVTITCALSGYSDLQMILPCKWKLQCSVHVYNIYYMYMTYGFTCILSLQTLKCAILNPTFRMLFIWW